MTHVGSFSATSESSTASGCSPLRMGMGSRERCVKIVLSHAFGSRQLLLQERVVSVFGRI